MFDNGCPHCNGTGLVKQNHPDTGEENLQTCQTCYDEDEYLLEGGEYIEDEDRWMETYWNLFHKNY